VWESLNYAIRGSFLKGVPLMREPGNEVKNKNRGDRLGTIAVWLSAVSAVIYFFSSHAVTNHIVFLVDNLTKAIALK
jgi:hypothetical protein